MDEELSRFAQSIRERPRYLETKADIDELRRKLLVSQLRNVDAVYPWVADDLKTIEFRAPGVMRAFRASPAYLQQVYEQAQANHDNQSVLDDFVERVHPPKGQELFTYLSSLAKNTDSITHIFNGVEDVEERKRLIKAVQDYSTDHPDQLRQVGELMRSLEWPERDDMVELNDPIQQEEEEEPVESKQPTIAKPIRTLEISDPIDEDLEEKWKNSENLKKYKLHNQIGGLFPTKKVVVQRILNKHNAPVSPTLLGKHQDGVEDHDYDSTYHEVCSVLPSDAIQKVITDSGDLQDFYLASVERPSDCRELLRQFMDRSGKVRRNYSYPETLPEVIGSILHDWATE